MGSRRRRSQNQSQGDPFQQPAVPTGRLEDFANTLYGGGKIDDELRRADARSSRIKQLALESVRPDAAQARRVMPFALRSEWLKRPERVPELLDEWWKLANQEAESKARPAINIKDTLNRDPSDMLPLHEESELPEAGPIESSFLAVLQLAASIHLHGLANPITVVAQEDGTYLLESGERRLLAYNLLQSLPEDFVEGHWDTIPARIVEERNIWRQAAENGARLDLNAISMARQLALLLMDIYADRYSFARYSEMPGVEWYAQVYDSKKYPVPYGRGAELAAAMGLKSAAQIRQYRQLLALPSEAWQIADELNWTEYRIRELMRRARSVTTVTDSDTNLDDANEIPTESVTTVTDRLMTLFQFEAGQLDSLPSDLQAVEEDAEPIAPRTRGKAGQKSTARSLVGTITTIDPTTSTLTLQIEDVEILQALTEGQTLKITISRNAS